jgi:hypothetical protein
VAYRVELPASSHNCFTPVETACDAHFIADRGGSGTFLGLSGKRFILVPPGNRNRDRSPHILDQGWRTYGSCAQNGTQEDFFGTQNSVVPFFFNFFWPANVSILWRICLYIHIPDNVKTAYQLLLLPNNAASENFIHKLGEVRNVDWLFIFGKNTWHWTECFTIFTSKRKQYQAGYFHIFFLIAFLKEDFIRNIIQ